MSTTTTDQTRGLSHAIVAPLEDGTIWTIEKAYDYCERLARSHYENFPVGSVLVPKHLRKHFYSIYAFARTADDFADEGYDQTYPESERLRLLEKWHQMLGECLRNKASILSLWRWRKRSLISIFRRVFLKISSRPLRRT